MQNSIKCVLLARKGISSIYIAKKLADCGYLDAIVLETGKKAKKKKLKRFLKGKFWQIPMRFLDLLFILYINKCTSNYIKQRFYHEEGICDYPENVPQFIFDGVNDQECVSKLRELEPDVLVVFGTSILKQPVIKIPKIDILNIHCGIVPKYRNVHSEFWAMVNDEPNMIGTTIIHLDETIDGGAIAIQDTLGLKNKTPLVKARYENLKLAAELICKAIKLEKEGKLPFKNQDKTNIGFFRTPRLNDWLKYRHKIKIK